MQKHTLIALLGGALVALNTYSAELPEALAEHVSFYLSFDNSLAPDQARGSDRIVTQLPADTYSYIPGVSKQAILGKEKVRNLFYVAKDNLDFSRPGAVSFWFNPVDWVVQTPDTPTQGQTKWKKTMTAGFFAMAYSPNGYIVLQRNTSHIPGNSKDMMMLLFPCMKNYNKANRIRAVNIAMKTWHHMALTWNGISYRVYLDKQEIFSTDVPQKITMDKLNKYFNIYMAKGLAFDEFYIFDQELTPAEIGKLGTK